LLDSVYLPERFGVNKEHLSRTRALAAKVIFAAFQVLKEGGGQAPGREVIAEVEKRVPLDDWARATYEKSRNVRWQSILHFFSIDCIKAGFLIKKNGVWYLTPEGDAALKMGDVILLEAASKAYRQWRDESQPNDRRVETETANGGPQGQEATIHEMEQVASEGLKKQINQKNPYEFQELVAALLRGMGLLHPVCCSAGQRRWHRRHRLS